LFSACGPFSADWGWSLVFFDPYWLGCFLNYMLTLSSFRDPGGFCFQNNGRLLRAISPESLAEIEPFLNSNKAKSLIERRHLVSSRKLDVSEQDALLRTDDFQRLANGRQVAGVFEHERIEFASYPYEWAPEMLYAAGRLTLDLAQSCITEGYSLKDASPYNILFRKSQPIFVDLLSFELRNPCDPIWNPYAQFCRNFLLPLLAHRTWGIRPGDIFNTRRDGIQPGEIYRHCHPLQKLRRPFLTLVSMPTWLSGKTTDNAIYRKRSLKNPEKAGFILNASFNRLRRILQRLRPNGGKSIWLNYTESHSYPDPAFRAKEDFLRSFLQNSKPQRILDVGANTGHFSALAARENTDVVSIDSDAACIGALWQRAQSEGLNILPLVVDFSWPSAGQGWRNGEYKSFLERAAGAFDAVVMFGVLHHLLVAERIPLAAVLEVAARLTHRWLLIEFIPPQDPMFQILARGRDSLHADLTRSGFEDACSGSFDLVRSQQLPGMERWLYLLRRRS
jgi:SAM-dependent methyltransferase